LFCILLKRVLRVDCRQFVFKNRVLRKMFILEEGGSNRRVEEIAYWGAQLLGKYWGYQNQKDEKSGVCGMLYVQFLAKMLAILIDVFHDFPLFFQTLVMLPLLNITFFSVYHSVTALLCAVEKVSLGYIYYVVYINSIIFINTSLTFF
jgi:hypothetical protein